MFEFGAMSSDDFVGLNRLNISLNCLVLNTAVVVAITNGRTLI